MPFEFNRALVPAALAERRQWLIWKFEAKRGQTKPAKMPYYASKKRRAGVQGGEEDRAALVSLDEALAVAQQGIWAGVGFAFLPGDGLIGVDLDKVIDPPWPDETAKIKPGAQRIIEACNSYTEYSPSGAGIHIIVAGQMDGVEKSNDIGVEIFCGRQFFTFSANTYPGSPADVQPISADALARLQQVVRDAKAKRRDAAKPAAQAAASSTSPPPAIDKRAKVESALAYISPEVGYHDWLAVGMAIREELGEGGLAVWEAWSARSAKFVPAEMSSKWKSFTGTYTVGPMYKLATDAGWRPPRAARPAPTAKPAGKDSKPISTADGPPGDSGGDIPGDPGPFIEVDEPDDWRRHLLHKNGKQWAELLGCRENVLMVLRDHPDWAGVLAADTFAKKIIVRRDSPLGHKAGAEWCSNDDIALGLWLAQQEAITVGSLDTIASAMSYVAKLSAFHPVLEYFDSLVWDGLPRVDAWGPNLLGTRDDEYDRLVGRLFLINLVRRIYEPGCVMRSVPVLEGAQNKGKSTALRLLAEPWYSDTMFRVGDKDVYQLIQGVMVYEISELESFSKSEATAVKAFISSVKDTFRAPYARTPESHLRQVMFAATTNAREYLKDWTGNTRFWPWKLMVEGPIRLDEIAKWRDQLLAEAIHMYKAGERSYPTREQEEALFAPQQELRTIQHPWEDMLREFLDGTTVTQYTGFELLRDVIKTDMSRISPTGLEMQTMGRCMDRLGWTKTKKDNKNIWERPKEVSTAALIDAPASQVTDTSEQKVDDDDVPF